MLVCWKRDGAPKFARPLSAGDVALTELEHSADMLAEARAALEEQADNIEWRDEGTANNLRRVADRCRAQERDARAAVLRAAEVTA